MKKALVTMVCLFFLTACGNRTESATPQPSAEEIELRKEEIGDGGILSGYDGCGYGHIDTIELWSESHSYGRL